MTVFGAPDAVAVVVVDVVVDVVVVVRTMFVAAVDSMSDGVEWV